MPDLSGVDRRALEAFASQVLDEHGTDDKLRCRSCGQVSPCTVERTAITHGLLKTPPHYLDTLTDRWTVTATMTTLHLETDWRLWGHGHMVTFDRQAVVNNEPPDVDTCSPEAREAWDVARAWVAQNEVHVDIR